MIKVGDVVAFRVGIRRIRAFGIVVSLVKDGARRRSTIKRLDGIPYLYERSVVNVKEIKQLKGKDLALYHAFMLGVET